MLQLMWKMRGRKEKRRKKKKSPDRDFQPLHGLFMKISIPFSIATHGSTLRTNQNEFISLKTYYYLFQITAITLVLMILYILSFLERHYC